MLSKIETRASALKPERLSLTELIKDALDVMKEPAEKRNISITYARSFTSVFVHGDRNALEQVLINLLDNAVKYGREGGEIMLSAVEKDQGEIQISVKDNGIGIPPEDVPRIFERFYRVDKGRSQELGGTGLGLVDCNTELLACKRGDFFDIGMFQDPTGGHGWPNWDDVDFGYRAHLKGFRLLGAGKAIAEHWDYSISNRTTACQRFFRAGRSAVWLFKRYPDLQPLIPMFYDKTPLAWGQDSPVLITRKLARHLVSSPPPLGGIVKLVSTLEQHYPSPVVLHRLYYLLHGANMFQGYREGLRDYKLAGGEE